MRGFESKSGRENAMDSRKRVGRTSFANSHNDQLGAMEDRANRRPQVREIAQLQERLNPDLSGAQLETDLSIQKSDQEASFNSTIREAARDGVQTSSTDLPFSDQIAASFGHHEVSQIQAHLNPEASTSARAMNADAYASGNHVVFAGTPDLHTAAHEAAHVVQQSAGVQLSDGIGRAGDAYERHADAVADRVQAGRSAEDLLDRMTGGSDSGGTVQFQRRNRRERRKERQKEKRRQRAARKRAWPQEEEIPFEAELPRAEVIELGAGEGAFSEAFQKEFLPPDTKERAPSSTKKGGSSNKKAYLATDIGGETEIVDQAQGGTKTFLSTAREKGLRTQHGVDANRLKDQFKPGSAKVIIAANPHGGGKEHPGLGYGLMRYTGWELENGAAARVPDERALQEARDVLKDNVLKGNRDTPKDQKKGGELIFRGRSNVLHQYLKEQEQSAQDAPFLRKTNPYLNVDEEHLHQLARLGYKVTVTSVTEPKINRDEVGGGFLDTPQRTVALGSYNTQISFEKTDDLPSVTFKHGSYSQTELSVSNTVPRSKKKGKTEPKPHQKLTSGKAFRDFQEEIDAGYEAAYGLDTFDDEYDDEEDQEPVIQQQRSGTVQRVLNETQQKIYDELAQAAEGPDGGLREHARQLLQSLTDPSNDANDRKMVGMLLSKFSEKGGKKGAIKAVKMPKPWEWTEDKIETARILADARDRISSPAIIPEVGKPVTLPADPRDSLASDTQVPVFDYRPHPRAVGLRLWSGLRAGLAGVDAPDSLHRIHFETIEGERISVALSQHPSALTGEPDYFLHDSRAPLVKHSTMGIMQGEPTLEQQEDLSNKGDTLKVSYDAFLAKINLLKSRLHVSDAKVAEWALLIIMSPSIAPAVVRDEAPEIQPEDFSLLYELVTTWMVAESIRHTSSMISGIMELELIESGQRTFVQSLIGTGPEGPTHPMTHIGSESQGREAEQAENLIAKGKKPGPASQVTLKQVKQIQDSYGGRGAEGVADLVSFYTEVLEKELA